jgi:hypothetical protein
MRTLLIGLASASFAAVTVAAQNPPPMPPQEPTTQTQPRTGADPRDTGRTVTVEGCLMREADVPGLKPNIAERAGVTEDFVITSAKVIKGSDPAAGESRSTASTMFGVEGLSKNQIESNLNRRVEIDGTIEGKDDRARGDTTRSPVPPRPEPSAPDPTPNPRGMKAPGDSAGDLAQLQAKAIRTVPGDCPAAR